jgi:outer membrane immunogenic protein
MTVMFQRLIRLVLLLLTLTLSITAHAQDPKDSKSAQDSFNWSGLYLGGNGGLNLPRYDMKPYGGTVTFPPFPGVPVNFFVSGFSETQDGFVGGGQIGYNYQLGHLVLGLEADFDGVNSTRVKSTFLDARVPFPFRFIETQGALEMNWNASARLRAGFAWRRFLFYATAGGAFARLDLHEKESMPPDPRLSVESSSDQTVAGWTAGAGVDWAVTKVVTVGLEYRHSGFGTDSYSFASTPLNTQHSANIRFSDDQITLRVNLLIGRLMGR